MPSSSSPTAPPAAPPAAPPTAPPTVFHMLPTTPNLLPLLSSSLPQSLSSPPSVLIISHSSLRSVISTSTSAPPTSPVTSADIKWCASNKDIIRCLGYLPSFNLPVGTVVFVLPEPRRHGKDRTFNFIAALCEENIKGGKWRVVLVDFSGGTEGREVVRGFKHMAEEGVQGGEGWAKAIEF
ncbi:hypothetical protein TrVE_jg9442 [Triparma verrucosa]|uniref:Uncharacterized protein n=1 Tax=Triparma verrucosa TaxID=1606542 RepID=A0A9W7EYZ1_9STRA|nr:hypothetical protein TrVE_jg9442 [Triparma verrucosa]